MKKSTLMVLGMAASLVFSTALFASESGAPDFATLDANQDGALSADEAASDPALSTNWSAIDTDENGVVDQSEFSAFESMREDSSGEGSGEAQ